MISLTGDGLERKIGTRLSVSSFAIPAGQRKSQHQIIMLAFTPGFIGIVGAGGDLDTEIQKLVDGEYELIS